MIRKKICLLGAFAVGKTSLVRRFVHSIFSSRYKATLGVRIEKKVCGVLGNEVVLLIWDMEGNDLSGSLQKSYLRGSEGFMMVADGTRPPTLETVRRLRDSLREEEKCAGTPFILALNKFDLVRQWQISENDMEMLRGEGFDIFPTSAFDGRGVEEAFLNLARRITQNRDQSRGRGI